MGVFHPKAWWSKSASLPQKFVVLGCPSEGTWDVPKNLPGCPRPLGAFKKSGQKALCKYTCCIVLICRPLMSGWHLCRTKLPRKVFNPKTKIATKSKAKSFEKRPETSPKMFTALFSRLRVFHQHFFTALHPQFQTRFQTLFFTTRVCGHGNADLMHGLQSLRRMQMSPERTRDLRCSRCALKFSEWCCKHCSETERLLESGCLL